MHLECTQNIGRGWSQANDTSDQQNIWNLRAAQGFEISTIFLNNKPQIAKFCDHRTFSLISHVAKLVGRILWRRIEGVLGEVQFGFIKRKGTRFAIGVLRIISERTLDRDEGSAFVS
jgi:hypothetical protein